jgi:hypothetical protein
LQILAEEIGGQHFPSLLFNYEQSVDIPLCPIQDILKSTRERIPHISFWSPTVKENLLIGQIKYSIIIHKNTLKPFDAPHSHQK